MDKNLPVQDNTAESKQAINWSYADPDLEICHMTS